MTDETAVAHMSLEDRTSSLDVCPESATEAMHSHALLSRILCLVDSIETLAVCSIVCKLWHSVLEADDIWRSVYLSQMPVPQEYERVPSYKQQFRRMKGLLQAEAPQLTALKGSALCYNAATGNLVSYHPRQRMVSIQMPDGVIRSAVTDLTGGGSVHKALLASTGCELVVLAAFDGPLQLWDASSCQAVGILGAHPSFITSLDASGDLVASTCSTELRLWRLSSRQCLYSVPIGLPMPSPVLEPHIAVCHKQQLLALANCAAPAPSSVVKIYSTQPAGSNRASRGRDSNGSSWSAKAAESQPPQQQLAQSPPHGSIAVGSSTAPDATGALLLRELPVNAAADMLLTPGLLIVASCFHGRSVSSNTPYKSERPFTVVVQIWDTETWQLTRLVSPRLWTDYPIYTMQGTPKIALTQGMLLCATLLSGITRRMPSCCVHAWQLPRSLLKPAHPAPSAAHATASCGQAQASQGASNTDVRKLSVSPSKISGIGLVPINTSSVTSSITGNISNSLNNNSSSRGPEPFGEGAMALGRAAVATAGGAGQMGVSAANTVMLAVGEQDRDLWVPVVEDTGEGLLTVMLTTPTQLVMATDVDHILSSRLLPAESLQDNASRGLQDDAHVHSGLQQQVLAGGQGVGEAGGVQLAGSAAVGFVHVEAYGA